VWLKLTWCETQIANGIFLRLKGEDTEPIGKRIIETPEDVEAMEVLRDDRSGFIAYVPVGSIKKGEALVMAGGKTTRCTSCHGEDLMGLAPCRDSQAALPVIWCASFMTCSTARVPGCGRG